MHCLARKDRMHERGREREGEEDIYIKRGGGGGEMKGRQGDGGVVRELELEHFILQGLLFRFI